MSEELRDEHLNKRLNEAFTLKNLGGDENSENALAIYLEIINLDFLKVRCDNFGYQNSNGIIE